MHTIKVYYGSRLYGNRIIGEELPEPKYTFTGINFILGDGISTVQTLNNINSEDSPSYLTATDENDNTTLWYVINSQKNRKNQLTLGLKRDFLDEYWDKLKNQPFICQKSATIPDSISYAKYSKTMNLSQIKIKEYPLIDEEGKGWIVIYFNKTYSAPAGSASPWDSDGKAKIVSYSGDYDMTLLSEHINCVNSPCDILAIPIGGTLKSRLSGQSDREIKLNTFRMVLDLTYSVSAHFSGMIADIQYLPYVSTSRIIDGNPDSDDDGWSRIIDTFTNETIGWAIWQRYAYYTKRVTNSDFDKKELPEDNVEQRKYNEEHMFRLCSPNFASSFEFSPIKNESFPNFIVHGILRPINPYIYVEPNFGGLYGSRFDDGRGLIFSGDFSLDQISDPWSQYKLQNKNYELIFNRQIQSMDLSNKIADQDATWNIAHSISGARSGAASGAAAGAVLGTMIAPGIGTAIGAIAGGAASSGGGLLDIADTIRQEKNAKSIRDDARSAAIDNFQYQIGNIQAMPSTLTKISAINQDFKIFPIIEEYECTDQEKRNVNNAVRFNGLDINLITTLSEFSRGFVEGSIVRFPSDIDINEAQAQAINSELQYGIYYKEV